MFSTDTSRCPVNIFQLYLSKRPSQLRSNDPLNLSIIHKPVSNSLWHKNVPMGQNTINSIMKRMIENSPLWNSDKKLRNYSAITGHNSEAGLDVYNSWNEEQQRAISDAIDTVNKDPVHFSRYHSKLWVILPNDKRVKNPTFSFLDQKWASPKSTNYHFHSYTVNFYNGENSVQHQDQSKT